jgi:glycosyltransferase involved in cell wall biosynthesis
MVWDKKTEDVFVVRTSPAAINTKAEPNPEFKKGRRYLAGYIGVLGSSDGVEYLIKAAHHVVKTLKRDDIQFLLMGSGPEYAMLKALRDELGLTEYVEMPGRVSDEYLASALATIDVGVSCDPINDYNHHCTMNKVLEYMAFSKPQVMFDLVEGKISAAEASVYVTENSAEKLAEAIIGVLEDPAASEKMGRLGRSRLDGELSWQTSTKNLVAAVERALSSAHS